MAKKIPVKGNIVNSSSKWIYDWLGIEATSPKDIGKALADANGEDVEIEINSGGGDISAGSEIYTALRGYSGKVLVSIVGLAASAASVIAMAGESQISPTALFMIHNVKTDPGSVDHNGADHTSEILRAADRSVANAYKAKTGLTDKQLLDLMDRETYMSAEEAVKNKFVDRVMFQNQKISLYNATQEISEDAIEKLRHLLKPGAENGGSDFLRQKAQAKLKFLNLEDRTK